MALATSVRTDYFGTKGKVKVFSEKELKFQPSVQQTQYEWPA
jgi:hypothetical protein